MFRRQPTVRTPQYLWVSLGLFGVLVVVALAGYPKSGFVFCVVASAVGWVVMRRLDTKRDALAYTWPISKATVESAARVAMRVRGRNGRELIANPVEIAYSYVAAGEHRAGFQLRSFPSLGLAAAFIEAANGATLEVHVNPQDPAETLLEESSFREILPDPDTWGDPIGRLQSR